LKRRLEEAKGSWPEELPHVLWAYRTTPHSTTKETPFAAHFRDRGRNSGQSEGIKMKDDTPTQPNRQHIGDVGKTGFHR